MNTVVSYYDLSFRNVSQISIYEHRLELTFEEISAGSTTFVPIHDCAHTTVTAHVWPTHIFAQA